MAAGWGSSPYSDEEPEVLEREYCRHMVQDDVGPIQPRPQSLTLVLVEHSESKVIATPNLDSLKAKIT